MLSKGQLNISESVNHDYLVTKNIEKLNITLLKPIGQFIKIFSFIYYESRNNFKYKILNPLSINSTFFLTNIDILDDFISRKHTKVLQDLKIIENKKSVSSKNNIESATGKLFRCHVDDCYKCLVMEICKSEIIIKNVIDSLTNSTSQYRTELSELTKKLIMTKEISNDNNTIIKTIFNYISSDDEAQLKMFDISMFIMSILTKSYSFIYLAHSRSYSVKIKNNQTKDALDDLRGIINLVDNFYHDINLIVTEVKLAVDESSRKIYASEPVKHQRGVTYDRLSHLIQAEPFEYWCYPQANPATHQFSSFSGMTENQNNGRYKIGSQFNCQRIKTITSIYTSSIDRERTYHHFTIDYDYLAFFTKTLKSWGKYDQNFFLNRRKFMKNCDINWCHVDQIGVENSVRRISTSLVLASPGFCVTGVRWLIKNKIVYLEIQQGKIFEGRIDPTVPVEWKISPENSSQVLILNETFRTFYLDDITLPARSYVTGVQFGMLMGNLAIQELMLDRPDASEFSGKNNILSVPGMHYVKFQPTDLEKDAGQLTVPYFDIQEVVTNPPSPVGGVGTYYKGSPGFGGYIGLELLPVNIFHQSELDYISILHNETDHLL
ncbi:hypothetical protein HCN44_003627 [Aphidius gifuensis]|uniref:Uncharacterized protein n=1 Tax=Aphidius gifuensis TaxID=684658 RepID=A0A835CKF8_APHGI|nr:hypothetical protein HCN44_003627 [Aphidius gifuensis]